MATNGEAVRCFRSVVHRESGRQERTMGDPVNERGPVQIPADNPIRVKEEDRLGRGRVAEALAREIRSLDASEGCVLGVHTAPLSVSNDAGNPQAEAALWKLATTSAALNTLRASEAARNWEWSSITFRISTSVPPESFQWVMSACHRS